MKQYIDLLVDVLKNGVDEDDRTGTGCTAVFGRQMRFDLRKGFPLLTTKKIHWKSVVHELIWFMRGDTNIKYLNDNGVTIWDEWANEEGECGPIYGYQWRSWPVWDPFQKDLGPEDSKWRHIDQLKEALDKLVFKPRDRRNIVSAWNVPYLDDMGLPPCHLLFQFYVNPKTDELSCQMYQRSCDLFLGVPFNIASYALLTHIMASMAGLNVGEFIWTGGNVHLYSNHIEQAREQVGRAIRPGLRPLPTLSIPEVKSTFEDWQFDDFVLEGYNPQPVIKAPISV